MQKHDVKLQQLAGCAGCKKACKWSAPVASEKTFSGKFNCNSSK